MIHHVEIYVSDLARTQRFWTWLLGELGYEISAQWEQGFSLRFDETYLTFVQVEAQHAHRTYHRCGVGLNHLAFFAPTRAAVDSLRAQCLARNESMLYDERYPHANGGTEYYALFLEDPDRIKVEIVARQ